MQKKPYVKPHHFFLFPFLTFCNGKKSLLLELLLLLLFVYILLLNDWIGFLIVKTELFDCLCFYFYFIN